MDNFTERLIARLPPKDTIPRVSNMRAPLIDGHAPLIEMSEYLSKTSSNGEWKGMPCLIHTDPSKQVELSKKQAIPKENAKNMEAEEEKQKDDWFLGHYQLAKRASNYRAPMEIWITKTDRDGSYIEEVIFRSSRTRNEFRTDFGKSDNMVAKLDSRGLYIEESKELIPNEFTYTDRDYRKPFSRHGWQYVVIIINDVPTVYTFTPY